RVSQKRRPDARPFQERIAIATTLDHQLAQNFAIVNQDHIIFQRIEISPRQVHHCSRPKKFRQGASVHQGSEVQNGTLDRCRFGFPVWHQAALQTVTRLNKALLPSSRLAGDLPPETQTGPEGPVVHDCRSLSQRWLTSKSTTCRR